MTVNTLSSVVAPLVPLPVGSAAATWQPGGRPYSNLVMRDSAPSHAAFDRAAATILGSMITLIAALSFALVQASVGNDGEQVPVAASVPGAPGTP